MARSTLKDSEAHQKIRIFFEKRVANWDGNKKEDKPRWNAEVVATAATLAFNDSLTTGKLHPSTRTALDRMWTLQKRNGAWEWLVAGRRLSMTTITAPFSPQSAWGMLRTDTRKQKRPGKD
jgi:squalene-hopene/tetraprenyl-beta-curcumene cyclase